MIEAVGLTKRFGAKTAVDHLSFQVKPGHVTGFLGPNGSGKSTTMRMIVGLDRPTSGRVTINGLPFRDLPNAQRHVGALLDAKAVHGGRRARTHLLVDRPALRDPGEAGGRGAGRGRPPGRGPAAHEGLLARHGPAARHRHRPARRPPGAAVRRAGQRTRPRGHPLGPQPDAPARLRGPHRLRLLAPDERDGTDRRPPDRDRPGPAAGRHGHPGVHHPQLGRIRSGAHGRHQPRMAGTRWAPPSPRRAAGSSRSPTEHCA